MHGKYSQGCVPELWQHRSLAAEACVWTTCGEFLVGFCLFVLVCCLFAGGLFGVLFVVFVCVFSFFNIRIKLLKIELQ